MRRRKQDIDPTIQDPAAQGTLSDQKRDRLNKLWRSNATRESDLGFTSTADNRGRQLLPDGTFNVRRMGQPFLQRFSLFHELLNMSWTKFSMLVLGFYAGINLVFTLLYLAVGAEQLGGMHTTEIPLFWDVLFFSTQTFTTVGYGVVHPLGFAANMLASFETMFGWLSFAVLSGLVYGRFSRARALLLFSEQALLAPYKDISAFMFRIVNGRRNQMMEVEVSLTFSFEDILPNQSRSRRFMPLKLESSKVNFFPLNWTIVHPIDAESPLAGLTVADLESMDAEFMIMVRGFDDTYSQHVYHRHSYKATEMQSGRKFASMYHFAPGSKYGDRIHLHLDKLSETVAAPLPGAVPIDLVRTALAAETQIEVKP